MAPFTPNGNPPRRNLYGDGQDSYGGGGGSNTYSTGRGSYGSDRGGKNVYSDSQGKFGVGATGKNSYMTGVSDIAPEKASPKSWTKVHKSSFPKGGIMRSSAPKNTDGGTGNGYAERDTSSLYYTGGAAYQKGSRSSAPKRKSEASIPLPASFSLGSMLMDMDEPGYAVGGSVGYGMQRPVRPEIPPNAPPDYRVMGKGFGQRMGEMGQSIGDRWRDTFGTRSGERDYSRSAPYMSGMQRHPHPTQPQAPMQAPQPPAGGYPPPPAHSMPQMPQPAPAPSAGPSGSIPPPAFQNSFWRR